MKADERAMRLSTGLMALILFFVTAGLLNLWRGSFESGFGTFDDEASHLVTGFMFRDYVAQGFPDSPLQYAQDYYVHYPKVGIGQWPPVFYGAEGLWMLAFGDGTRSLVLFLSFLAAAVATLVFVVVRDDVGYPAGFAFGLTFLLLPLVQQFSSVMMTEMFLALACLGAAWQFGLFLDRWRPRNAAGFALFATLGVLCKGNALALALVPPLAIAFSGRWEAFKRPALWLAGLAVGVLCAPWYAFTLSISSATWVGADQATLSYALEALPFYGRHLLTLGGVVIAVLAVVGLFSRPKAADRRGRWASVTALVPALILFHCLVPSSIEERHLVLMAPAVILLAAWGTHWLMALDRVHVRSLRLAPALVLPIFLMERFEIPSKRNLGYDDAVRTVLADPGLNDSVLLIASDPIGEGLFVGGTALHEERLGHVVLRGSKVLGHTSWMGTDYEPIFADAAEMDAWLRRVPVGIIAFDHSMRPWQRYEHHELLLEVLESQPSWEPYQTFDVVRDGALHQDALQLYRLKGHRSMSKTSLEVASLLGRNLPGICAQPK